RPAVSLTVPSPTPTVTGPDVVAFPPVASSRAFRSRWNTPGSSAGTVTLRSSIVAVQRVDCFAAVTVWPPSGQLTVAWPPKGVSTCPVHRPGWNAVGCPRSGGSGENAFELPTGIMTGKPLSLRYPQYAV